MTSGDFYSVAIVILSGYIAPSAYAQKLVKTNVM